MQPQTYIDTICRAVEEGNADLLVSMAQRLSEAEEAITILRAKGYGTAGMSLLDTAKKVPSARFLEE